MKQKNSLAKTFIPLVVYVVLCLALFGAFVLIMIAVNSALGITVVKNLIGLFLLIFAYIVSGILFFKYYISILRKEFSSDPEKQQKIMRMGKMIIYGIFTLLLISWQVSNVLSAQNHSAVILFVLTIIFGLTSVLYFFANRKIASDKEV